MKNIAALTLCLFTLAAQANQGGIYERLGTAGEYPTAFKTTRALSIKLRIAPTTLFKRTENCRLKAGHDIGFAKLQKTTQIGLYRTLAPTTLYGWEGDIALGAGENVEVLSYLAEGNCEMRAQGRTVEGTCINATDDQIEALAELKQENWYYISCENTNGWALEEDLLAVDSLSHYTVTY